MCVCARARVSRRAYDALNVLTAMDIISKDKKDIQWKGFPPMVGDGGERAAGASSAGRDKEKARLKSKIDQKSKDLKQREEQLKELVNQFVSLKQLLGRNAKPEYSENADQLHRIYLPFVIGLQTKPLYPKLVVQIYVCRERLRSLSCTKLCQANPAFVPRVSAVACVLSTCAKDFVIEGGTDAPVLAGRS